MTSLGSVGLWRVTTFQFKAILLATLLLSVGGQALGAALGGPVGATIGRALGALAGSAIDNQLFGEDQPTFREVCACSARERARQYRASMAGPAFPETLFGPPNLSAAPTRAVAPNLCRPRKMIAKSSQIWRSGFAKARWRISVASGGWPIAGHTKPDVSLSQRWPQPTAR